jgi:hypothetical protein
LCYAARHGTEFAPSHLDGLRPGGLAMALAIVRFALIR